MTVKICLTGGPSGGKSTSLAALEQELLNRGWKVFIIPETATELIINGITPAEIDTVTFQEFVIRKQFSKEKIFEEAAALFDKSVILCDRGFLDTLAYISRNDMEKIASSLGMDFNTMMHSYDAVIHLVTAAKGTDAYTIENNPARTETPEQAIEKDELTLKSWLGHPHLRVVDNSTNFSGKIARVIEEVFDVLGEPEPKEIERKYLIKKPSEVTDGVKTHIIQTYLNSSSGKIERRVRQRGTKKTGFSFFYTEKSEISAGERIEIERKIDMRQYIEFLEDADISCHQLRKDRTCFIYENQYFELDEYPFSDEFAILELEVKSLEDTVILPPFIEVIKEVTGDNKYSNHSLAKSMTF